MIAIFTSSSESKKLGKEIGLLASRVSKIPSKLKILLSLSENLMKITLKDQSLLRSKSTLAPRCLMKVSFLQLTVIRGNEEDL